MSRLVFSPLERETVFGPEKRQRHEGEPGGDESGDESGDEPDGAKKQKTSEKQIQKKFWDNLVNDPGVWNQVAKDSLMKLVKERLRKRKSIQLGEGDVHWSKLILYEVPKSKKGMHAVPKCAKIPGSGSTIILGGEPNNAMINEIRKEVLLAIRKIAYRAKNKRTSDDIKNHMFAKMKDYLVPALNDENEPTPGVPRQASDLGELISDIDTPFPRVNENHRLFTDGILNVDKFTTILNNFVDNGIPQLKKRGESTTRSAQRKATAEDITQRLKTHTANMHPNCNREFESMDNDGRRNFERSILDERKDPKLTSVKLKYDFETLFEFDRYVHKEVPTFEYINVFIPSLQAAEERLKPKYQMQNADAIRDRLHVQALPDGVRGSSFAESEEDDDTEDPYPNCTKAYNKLNGDFYSRRPKMEEFLLQFASGDSNLEEEARKYHSEFKEFVEAIYKLYLKQGGFKIPWSGFLDRLNEKEKELAGMQDEQSDHAISDGDDMEHDPYPNCSRVFDTLESDTEKWTFLKDLIKGSGNAKQRLPYIIQQIPYPTFTEFIKKIKPPVVYPDEYGHFIENVNIKEAELSRRDEAGPSSAAQHIVTGMRLLQL